MRNIKWCFHTYLSGIDDFVDAGHTQRDVHRRDARKVERLQCHLCAWLADALSSQRAHCGAYKKRARMLVRVNEGRVLRIDQVVTEQSY